MQISDEFSIQKYFSIFHKYKWYALAPACLLMAALYAASSYLPEVYESTCIIEVERGTIENPLRTDRERPSSLRDQLSSFSENAFNWNVLSLVIDKVGPDKIFENSDVYNIGKLKKRLKGEKNAGETSDDTGAMKEAASAMLKESVTIRERRPRFLVLKHRGTISQVNADILNTLVSALVEERERSELRRVGRSHEFLQAEMENYRSKLEDAEHQLREFKEQHATELPNNISIHLTQLTEDQSEVLARELEMKELATRLAYIDEALENQEQLVVSEIRRETNPMLVVLSERIVDMEIELTRLRTNYTDLHPSVLELRGQVVDLKKKYEEHSKSTVNTETSMLNPVHQQMTQDRQETLLRIEVLKSRMENLTKRIAENEEKVRGVPAQEQQLLTLTRNYEVTANIYNMFLQRLEEARIQEKLAGEERSKESFKILEYARPTITPVAPDRLKALIIILMLGGATGIGIMLLLDFFDDSLNSVEEAKSLIKKPLLGTIPALGTRNGNGLSLIGKAAPRPESEDSGKL